MQTSLELKTCSRFFGAFLKSTLNLEYLETKDQSQSLIITEILTAKQVGTEMAKTPSFMQRFGR